MVGRSTIRRLAVSAAIAAGTVAAAIPATASPATMRVGSVTVHRCHNVVAAWCGVRREPIDPAHPAAGKLGVSFVWYPATARPAGTIVAVEGGPGFPSTGSAPEYRALFRPLLATRNLLLVDNRGTGGTARIRCRALQGFAGDTATNAFNAMVGICGRHLAGASDLYATPTLRVIWRASSGRSTPAVSISTATPTARGSHSRSPRGIRRCCARLCSTPPTR